jgi:hypothetical protein
MYRILRACGNRRAIALPVVEFGVEALARAFRWQRMLDEGRYGSISEMARAERIERGFMGRVLRLALLAPDIVEAVLNGTQGVEVSLPPLLDGVSVVWGEQRSGTAAARTPQQGTRVRAACS